MSGGRGAQRLGRTWESRAAVFLRERGLRIIARGYRCRLGELDIIGTDEKSLVVVEVRARRRASLGSAMESIGAGKRQRIVHATRHFLMRNPEWLARPIRFDVVAIDGIDEPSPEIAWLKNAFDAA